VGWAVPGKKTPGGAGTHTGHTGHADAQRHTDQSHNQPNPPTTNTPHVSATTEAAADSTAASPKPTAPRGRPVRYPVKRHRGEPGHTRDTRNTRYPVKRHRGEPGHTRDTRDTRTHKGTRTTQTNLTTIQTHQQHTPRTSARRPKPRPTQQPLGMSQSFAKFREKFARGAAGAEIFRNLPLTAPLASQAHAVQLAARRCSGV